MKLKTIHPRIIIDSTLLEFTPSPDNPNEYIGEVPDEIGSKLLKIRRKPDEFVQIHEPKQESGINAPSLETVYADSQGSSKGAVESDGAPDTTSKPRGKRKD